MRVRLVYITTRPSGAQAERLERITVESLHIGRGSDNDICLNGLTVSLQHATVEQRGDRIVIELAADSSDQGRQRVVVNGRSRQSARLSPGSTVRIGRFELKVLPTEDDEDLALRIEALDEKEDERIALDRRTRIGIEQGLFTRRRLSWLIVLLVLGVFGVLPFYSEDQKSWNSGPVSNKHAFIQNDCRRCHGTFEVVSNDGCLECHYAIEPHTRNDAKVAGLLDTRCAECHIEHNGTNQLADLGEALCTDCHASIETVLPRSKIEPAVDFGRQHPEFRVHVVTNPGSGEPTIARIAADPKQRLEERSGLRFNHLRHVGQSLPMPDGTKQRLQCDACHQLERDGSTMKPIRFASLCLACHRLTFDKDLPERDAIHADPVGMRQDLRELYSDQVLRGAVTDNEAPREVRFRRPGQKVTKRERPIVLAWVEKRVGQATRHLMGPSGECARCHENSKDTASDGGPDVGPVEVTPIWMPRSTFRHDTHRPFRCRDCHPGAAVFDPEDAPDRPRPSWSLAEARPHGLLTAPELKELHQLEPSTRSGDIMIPGIELCQGCHGGENASPPLVASPCGMCHPFHREELGPAFPRPADTAAGVQSRAHDVSMVNLLSGG